MLLSKLIAMSISVHHPFYNELILIKMNLYIISTHW